MKLYHFIIYPHDSGKAYHFIKSNNRNDLVKFIENNLMFEKTPLQYNENLANFKLSINNLLDFLLSLNTNRIYFDFMYVEVKGKTIQISFKNFMKRIFRTRIKDYFEIDFRHDCIVRKPNSLSLLSKV